LKPSKKALPAYSKRLWNRDGTVTFRAEQEGASRIFRSTRRR
jgi:hypothetical protein